MFRSFLTAHFDAATLEQAKSIMPHGNVDPGQLVVDADKQKMDMSDNVNIELVNEDSEKFVAEETFKGLPILLKRGDDIHDHLAG